MNARAPFLLAAALWSAGMAACAAAAAAPAPAPVATPVALSSAPSAARVAAVGCLLLPARVSDIGTPAAGVVE